MPSQRCGQNMFCDKQFSKQSRASTMQNNPRHIHPVQDPGLLMLIMIHESYSPRPFPAMPYYVPVSL
jgi:hypothetical protein